MKIKQQFKALKKYLTIGQLIKRSLLFTFVIIILLFLLSVLLSQKDFLSVFQNWFHLLGLVIQGAASLSLSFLSIIYEYIKEQNQFIKNEKLLCTESDNALRGLEPKLFGLPRIIHREEIQLILNLIHNKKGILLSGEAGSGKSSIGVELFKKCKENNIYPILFDVRRYGGIRTKQELSSFLGINRNVLDVIAGIAENNNCLLIFDQLDSVCDSSLGKFMVEFAIECMSLPNLSVLVISRHNEIEKNLLRYLLESDFEEIHCEEINEELVRNLFLELGLENPPLQIMNLSKNVLLLDLIFSILNEQGINIVDQLINEINIWKKYLDFFLQREFDNLGIDKKEIYQGLVDMAKEGLQNEDRSFSLSYPLTKIQNRYLSHGIVNGISQLGQRYIFKVDKFQDFLYAFFASTNRLLKNDVEKDISPIFHRNIYLLIVEIYKIENLHLYETFLSEVLSG